MERSIRNNFWLEFIELYKSKPELWKIKSEAYNDGNLKKEAYEELMIKLCEICPTADIDMVKMKLKTINACFKRELKKVRDSMQYGDSGEDKEYLPSWSYFRHLSFLADQEEEETFDGCALCSDDGCMEHTLLCFGNSPRDRYSLRSETEEIQLDAIEYTSTYDIVSKKKNNSVECLMEDAEYNGLNTASGSATTTTTTQPRCGSSREEMEKQNKYFIRCSTPNTSHKDDAELFGKCWAIEFRKLDSEQQVYAKRAIDEVLFHGRFGRLAEQSSKITLEISKENLCSNPEV